MLMMFIENQANVIGLIGVTMVLVAYILLQIEKLSQTGFTFSFVNFIGSIFILVSLFFYWNLSSFVIEISWLVISLFGVVKAVYKRYG